MQALGECVRLYQWKISDFTKGYKTGHPSENTNIHELQQNRIIKQMACEHLDNEVVITGATISSAQLITSN